MALPKDDWLETSQSMDYFCHGTCGHNHGASGTTSEDAEALLGMADNKKAIKQWLPRENKVVLSDSHVMLKENVRNVALYYTSSFTTTWPMFILGYVEEPNHSRGTAAALRRMPNGSREHPAK